MKTLYRYLLRQVLAGTLGATGVLVFVLVTANFLRDGIELLNNREVSLWVVLQLIGYLVPFVLTFALPWGLLVAVLLVFGRLAQNRELLALHANGISLASIVAPILWMALALSFFSFWINAFLGPRSRHAFKELFADTIISHPICLFQSQRAVDQFQGFRIFVGGRRDTELQDVHLWQIDEGYRPVRCVRARKAQILQDLKHHRLVLTLYKARQEERTGWGPNAEVQETSGGRADELPLEISLIPLIERMGTPRSTGGSTLAEIAKDLLDRSSILHRSNPTPVLTEIQKRLAFSFSCFTFALVGIPIALWTRRGETSLNLALSLAIVLAYYLVILAGDALKARTTLFPELIVWFPNFAFQLAGCAFLWKASRL
ncbi:LptF/LptG family permease [Candidatus Methylacidithermus pantelleriae]|uniref:Lipopolysaccharide export system permease protein n=1 Tax=Candidatus Methylacidithermus pantelleriae TaxID=2744239 RepID=A0A8J2BJ55_9BACT|nr:LptF/LptG family permease [Candidatus Methylacidithermus pantelleriae]CAF0696056.1 Lipopolysaccharide export system permease protein [Candidatus Methylacidithermus pantelleriae]